MYPDFLHGAPPTAACAAFFKESRIKFASAIKIYRKSGMWGTRQLSEGQEPETTRVEVCALSALRVSAVLPEPRISKKMR